MQLYWTEFLLKEMQGKSTLHFMDQITLKIGSTQPWMVELSRASMQCTNESCLLWISASIGKAPTNNKKTAQIAVLVGLSTKI
jgi:hypothetical protein